MRRAGPRLRSGMAATVIATGYGGPEVLRVADLPAGEPGPGEALIGVRAAGVNPIDHKVYSGAHGTDPARLPMRLGFEAAGVVLRAGPGATGPAGPVRPGDEVIAYPARGAYAAELVVPAGALVPKPAALDWPQAAALMLAGVTAWHALAATGVGQGDTVLIHGGAGGVGTMAVQLAAARGAWRRDRRAGPRRDRRGDRRLPGAGPGPGADRHDRRVPPGRPGGNPGAGQRAGSRPWHAAARAGQAAAGRDGRPRGAAGRGERDVPAGRGGCRAPGDQGRPRGREDRADPLAARRAARGRTSQARGLSRRTRRRRRSTRRRSPAPRRRLSRRRPRRTAAGPCRRDLAGRRTGQMTRSSAGSARRCLRRRGSGTRTWARAHCSRAGPGREDPGAGVGGVVVELPPAQQRRERAGQ